MGSLVSTLLAVHFGPGPEGAVEGRPTKRGVCFSSSLGVAYCFGLEIMAKGHMDKDFIPAPLATEFGPMAAWLKGLLLRLALAGPAGDPKNALLRRRLGCYVADCA